MNSSKCSSCCNAPVTVEGDDTHYYVCGKCGEPCDEQETPQTETTYSLPITIYTLEKTIEILETLTAKYRETVEDLKTMEGYMVDGS